MGGGAVNDRLSMFSSVLGRECGGHVCMCSYGISYMCVRRRIGFRTGHRDGGLIECCSCDDTSFLLAGLEIPLV